MPFNADGFYQRLFNGGCTVMEVREMETNPIRQGCEQLYPGSHELRPLALYQVASPLVPEGMVAIVSVEKCGECSALPAQASQVQTLEQLSALAEEIACQAKSTKEELSRHDLQK